MFIKWKNVPEDPLAESWECSAHPDGESIAASGQSSIRIEEDGSTHPLTLPKSNVVKLYLEDGSWVAVRPSGNEPKIKYYKEWMVP